MCPPPVATTVPEPSVPSGMGYPDEGGTFLGAAPVDQRMVDQLVVDDQLAVGGESADGWWWLGMVGDGWGWLTISL